MREIAFLTTDLNPACSLLTSLVGTANSVQLEPITTDLISSLLPRIRTMVDILVFNPPYVETDEAEVVLAQNGTEGMSEGKGIDKSWAGGVGGMEVTNRLLELVEVSFCFSC